MAISFVLVELRALRSPQSANRDAYAGQAPQVFAALGQITSVTSPLDVATAVYQAANDESERLSFPAGLDALALAEARRST